MALGSTVLLPRLSNFSSPSLCSFKRFIFFSTSLIRYPSFQNPWQIVPFTRPLCSTTLSSSLTSAPTHPYHFHESDGISLSASLQTVVEENNIGDEEEETSAEPPTESQQAQGPVMAPLPSFPTPKLSIKEKKELSSYAHSLGKKLKSQQIGKSGVTPTVAAAMVESLEANELLKLKVHGSCPGELSDVIIQLEDATGSTAVSIIGRTLILYRPSLAKMKKKDIDNGRMHQQNNSIKSVSTFKVRRKSQPIGTFS